MNKPHLLVNYIDWGLATLIAGGASVAGNIGSTLLTNSSNSSNVDKTNQQSIGLWREQAAYNTPQNQMARLKAAGLNPNLVYGNISSANASQAPALLAHQNVAPQVDPLTLAQIRNINADTEKKKSETKESESNIQVNASQIRLNDWTIDMQQQLTTEQVKIMQQSLQKSIAETNEITQKAENLKVEWSILDEKRQQEIIKTAWEELLKQEEYRKAVAEANLTEKDVEIAIQQLMWNPKLWQAEISFKNAETNLANSQKALTDEQKNDIKKKFDEWDSDVAKAFMHSFNNNG